MPPAVPCPSVNHENVVSSRAITCVIVMFSAVLLLPLKVEGLTLKLQVQKCVVAAEDREREQDTESIEHVVLGLGVE